MFLFFWAKRESKKIIYLLAVGIPMRQIALNNIIKYL